MEAYLPVDIDVFFSYIERVCGLLIINNRYRYDHSFHGIILPRSWLRAILPTFDLSAGETRGAQQLFWGLLQPLQTLLIQLYYGGDTGELYSFM
jgi:hypothetical protein